MTWGPFRPGLPDDERKAQFRSLRSLIRVQLGARGHAVGFAALRAEVSGGDDLLREAEAAFNKLPSLDRRHVLAAFGAVNFEKLREAS